MDLGQNKGNLLHKVSGYLNSECSEDMFGICLKGSLNFCVQIFSVTARSIQKDAEEKKLSFNPRPYFRLFINLLSELTSSDFHHDGANFQVHMLNWHVLTYVLILYILKQFHISKTF